MNVRIGLRTQHINMSKAQKLLLKQLRANFSASNGAICQQNSFVEFVCFSELTSSPIIFLLLTFLMEARCIDDIHLIQSYV
jgi:hypothetical protein